MDYINNTSPVTQNISENNNNNIELLKKLGFEFYIDNNGAIQSRRSKVVSIEKIFTDPGLIKQVKGGWFISDPTETYWIYVRILNGKIKEIIPITSIHINVCSIINYKQSSFDFIFLEYSTNTEHTDPKTAIITYKNYTPKRIIKDLTGTPYISEDGEKLKGSLLYYLVSQYANHPTTQSILYIGSEQGWWLTPLKKYRFNPSKNYRKEILENLPPTVRCRETPIQSTTTSSDITKELQPLFEDNPPFLVALLFRMGSLFSSFFAKDGINSDQIIVVHPNDNVTIELNCALFKNTSYDNLNCPQLGPNIKPLKNDLKNINDGIVLSIDSFAADQYTKIEKGLDLYINDINGATEEDTSVNHIPVIISSFSDLRIPKNMRCVLDYMDFKTKYSAIQYRNVLRRLDASLIYKVENDFNTFNKTLHRHIRDVKDNIPTNIPKSKSNTFIILITIMRTYNDLFSPLFPVSLEKKIADWLCSKELDEQIMDEIICSEFGKLLNNKISNGYFNFVLKEDVTPFNKGSHTLVVDQKKHRIYIETTESYNIAKNEMKSISDTDSITTALYSSGYLPHNNKEEKCYRIAAITNDGIPYPLYTHAIKYTLLTSDNKQRFSLIGKDMYLFRYDEIPTENFLPLGKTVDGRYFGKMMIYEEEESNIYFGTGRTGSGKSWAIAQILPMLFMLGHIVIVFDVSGTYTREKILNRKMLPVEVVDNLFKFINVGEKSDNFPINPFSFNNFRNIEE